MGMWKKATFKDRKRASGFKKGLKTGGVSTTADIRKKKGKYVVEYKV